MPKIKCNLDLKLFIPSNSLVFKVVLLLQIAEVQIGFTSSEFIVSEGEGQQLNVHIGVLSGTLEKEISFSIHVYGEDARGMCT